MEAQEMRKSIWGKNEREKETTSRIAERKHRERKRRWREAAWALETE